MSFFNTLGPTGPQMPMNRMQSMIQRYQQFRQTFSGDPKQQVQQMLNSGKVTQQQYNQAVQIAQQFQKMLGGK